MLSTITFISYLYWFFCIFSLNHPYENIRNIWAEDKPKLISIEITTILILACITNELINKAQNKSMYQISGTLITLHQLHYTNLHRIQICNFMFIPQMSQFKCFTYIKWCFYDQQDQNWPLSFKQLVIQSTFWFCIISFSF